MFTIDSLSFKRHFRVPLVSTAIGDRILPFVWAYAGHSFWLKMNTFIAQPAVTYMRDSLLLVDGVDALFESNVMAVPNIKVTEFDADNDGIADFLNFTIRVPLNQFDYVRRVRLAMFLRYDLDSVARMTMQSAILIDESTPSSASSLFVNADLKILIRTKLDLTSPSTWNSPRAINQPLNIHGRIKYAKDVYLYRPSIMEVLKFGWIQYLSYFALVYTISRFIFTWAIRSGVVRSHVIVDVLPKQDGFRGHVF
ncbi:hypothetical protein BCR33DRAFT_719522 [Rhizoclosmatium globosum]|uniref:Transmembrane protein 231 n=1 Tax=Rhizoclosmatium globosum TaxID=329046 RepID=A0A1Y2C1D3_9FUNG|nr:hypothetical protein BCR33DRAFT_719522 [Rhizoclosmatium globosum]|eukprot:ORY40115.1 hypothetical protein BCR33DRAFT_719522 [Rhizoclosmatium globosum]